MLAAALGEWTLGLQPATLAHIAAHGLRQPLSSGSLPQRLGQVAVRSCRVHLRTDQHGMGDWASLGVVQLASALRGLVAA